MAINRKTFTEINECQCGHGRARHADVLSSKGYICLLPDCYCYTFRAKPEDLVIPESKLGAFTATA
jgi:hypothetical protein